VMAVEEEPACYKEGRRGQERTKPLAGQWAGRAERSAGEEMAGRAMKSFRFLRSHIP
jgi:hypothetical protein